MSILKIAGKDGAVEPDKAALDALDALRKAVQEGRVTSFFAIVEGPGLRDYCAGGEIDLDVYLGFCQRTLLSFGNEG